MKVIRFSLRIKKSPNGLLFGASFGIRSVWVVLCWPWHFHAGAKKLATGNFFLTLSSNPYSLRSHALSLFAPHKKSPNGLLFGASQGIRTPDLWFRRPTLYPAELAAQICFYFLLSFLGECLFLERWARSLDKHKGSNELAR